MTFLKKEIMYMQLKFQHPVDIILSNGSTLSLSLSLHTQAHAKAGGCGTCIVCASPTTL